MLACLLVTACQHKTADVSKTAVPIRIDKNSDYRKVINDIAVVELSGNSDAYMGKIEETQVYDDYYLFLDEHDIMYLFKKDGKFISNSKKIFGKGNGEYYICLAHSYNKYSKNIEVVVPDGILFYDIKFNFIKKAKFGDKKMNSLMFNRISDLDASHHLLISPLKKGSDSQYYIFDSNKEETETTEKYPSFCGYITMQQQCISDDDFVAFPCMNYTFYKIDKKDYICQPYVTLDFGSKALVESDIKGKNDDEIQDFLLNCKKALPLKTFKSGDIIVSLIKNGAKPSDFKTAIINFKTKKYHILNAKYGNFGLPLFDYFKDNTIYACVSPEELSKYIDQSLLDKKSMIAYKSGSDKSNYFMVQYKLKDF